MSKKFLKLHPKSIAIIDRVIDAFSVKGNEVFYNQNVVAAYLIEEVPECGTACCIAGQMYWNEKGPNRYTKLVNNDKTGEMIDFAKKSMMYEDGTLAPGTIFNMASGWISPFDHNYFYAETAKERVRAGIRALKHYKSHPHLWEP